MFFEQLKSICEHVGKTPFYLFDEHGFIENYKTIETTFCKYYPQYRIAYSYKTNYTPYICSIVKRLGGYAEVVSDMEYELAKMLGYENKKVVYNGPAKGIKAEEHLDCGGVLNVDNYDEMVWVCQHAETHQDLTYRVGLRINIDVGGDFISRFGFDLDGKELCLAMQLLKKQSNVKLVGLHCHISRARGIEAWKKRLEIMLRASDNLIEGIPEYINLGSGMFASMSEDLKSQFGCNVPTYDDYSYAVMKPFSEHYATVPNEEKPILFTEPGTTLVARYLSFVTKVVNIKTIRGRHMATVDGSYLNLGEICTMKKLPLAVISSETNHSHYSDGIDILGYTCLEQDLLLKNFVGSISVGDILIFENCGAYSIVSKPQFIKPNCAMYTLNEHGAVLEIMREENKDDVFGKFNFSKQGELK